MSNFIIAQRLQYYLFYIKQTAASTIEKQYQPFARLLQNRQMSSRFNSSYTFTS